MNARDTRIYPTIGSEWRHKSGERYVVLDILNLNSIQPDYPITISYQRISDGTKWSRPLDKWRDSFEFDPPMEPTGGIPRPFSMEAARNGRPVCDVYGTPVRIVAWDVLGDYPIVGLTKQTGKDFEDVSLHTEGGLGDFMLYMAPEKVVKYSRIRSIGGVVRMVGELADRNIWSVETQVARIEWEE